jgi:hypothetical protein
MQYVHPTPLCPLVNLEGEDVLLFQRYFMFITNEMNYGHLIDPDNYNISRTEPELYEVFNNVKDWKARYLHPDYQAALEANSTIQQVGH